MGLADNYLLQNKDPLDAFFGGIQKYQTMQSNDMVNRSNEIDLQQKQIADQRQQQAIQALQTLDYKDPVALQKYRLLYDDLPVAKNVQNAFSQMQENERQNYLGDTIKYISAIDNNRPDIVVNGLREKADTLQKMGKTAEAAQHYNFAKTVEDSPATARSSLMMSYALHTHDKEGSNLKNVVEAISPKTSVINGGDKQWGINTNPVTGNATATPLVSNGTTPDKVLDSQTQVVTTGMNNTSAQNVAGINANSAANVANINGQYGVKTADINGQYGLQRESISQQGQNQRTQAQLQLDAQKLEHQRQQDEIKNHQAELKEFGDGVYVVYKDGSARKATDSLTKQFIAGKADKQQQADTQRIQKLDELLPEMDDLLKKPDASGSAWSAGVDYVKGKFGVSTEGAKISARLNTLAGQLVMLQPRMEGPQSDSDRKLYEKMAGNLADSTQPTETRLAALQQIKRLNDKYRVLNKQAKNGGGTTVAIPPADGVAAMHAEMTGD